MCPNFCPIEHCLSHGVLAEVTILKYLSKWCHNCSSNYGRLTLLSNVLKFWEFLAISGASPDKYASQFLQDRALRRTWRSDRAAELKYLSKWRHNCSSNYGTFTLLSNVLKFWEFLAISGASPDKHVSQFLSDRALPRTWRSGRCDRIGICVKLASQLLLILRHIYADEQCINFENFSRS